MNTDWTPTLWRDTFDEMLEEELEYNDSWIVQFNYSLQENLSKEERRRGWKIYCHRAYGNEAARGTVIMRPFRQACRGCSGNFELPGFSMEEVEKVLLKLIGKIKKNCYGEEEEDNSDSCSPEKVRTKPHESSLCEACSQGICCVED
ncbi:hypothetical protein ANANG_G00178520 [Anguilla anguilla]|uniref:3CxxC-type domain-containing protein n=1 Tax=Anguilla anguilla TaxID=7936 RepID=A0A9D3M4T1_ANGAN|nr:hypothetical protein ANANG_G00178520 [Anguilla anguilla]